MAARHRHRFQRLSDEALFCECGEVKDVRPQPAHYCTHWCSHPSWWYPVYSTWQPTITTGGTTSVPFPDTSVTYTLTS